MACFSAGGDILYQLSDRDGDMREAGAWRGAARHGAARHGEARRGGAGLGSIGLLRAGVSGSYHVPANANASVSRAVRLQAKI